MLINAARGRGYKIFADERVDLVVAWSKGRPWLIERAQV